MELTDSQNVNIAPKCRYCCISSMLLEWSDMGIANLVNRLVIFMCPSDNRHIIGTLAPLNTINNTTEKKFYAPPLL